MCRTAHAILSLVICGIQMVVRVIMTVMLMLENLLRMILQTIYNFMSFVLQIFSLLPICCVFLITSRMKCFMCGGGGPCPVNRGGACDCLMSLIAIIILFLIFRATGVLDKIFYSIGYAKATTKLVRYSPTTGAVTACSRNVTGEYYEEFYDTTTVESNVTLALRNLFEYYDDELEPRSHEYYEARENADKIENDKDKNYEAREDGGGDKNENNEDKDKYVDYLYDKLNKVPTVKDNAAVGDYEDGTIVQEKGAKLQEPVGASTMADKARKQMEYGMTTVLYYLA